jgi:ferredoxin
MSTVPSAPASHPLPTPSPPAFDLLHVPVVGALLRRPITRTVARAALGLLAAVMVAHGLLGPELAPRNLATLLTWVHYRGALVLVLLVAGNFFCASCPLVLARDIARRVVQPTRNWPRALRSKWLALTLFVGVLFCYELFGLWSSPAWTAWLILAYFAGAILVDTRFRHASFCKYVCPVGQFNFVSSLLSPLEVKVRQPEICTTCATKDCIRGRREPDSPFRILQRGCELALFQPRKVGNTDCTFCLDCVYACPHDNIGVSSRMPGSELWDDSPRSGVGRLSRRGDLSALVTIFTFGALLNAFAMVSPVYAVQTWLSRVLHTTDRAPILGILFLALLVIEPLVLMGLAGWLSRRMARKSAEPLLPRITRYAYALTPVGFGMWLAHYGFHFLTGFLTVIPVTQAALQDAGVPWFGMPAWQLSGMRAGAVLPLEIGVLGLGLLGSLLVAFRIAERDDAERALLAALPWMLLCTLLFAIGCWLLFQPMEMRGTFLGSS